MATAAAVALALPSASGQNKAVEEFTAVAFNTSTRPSETQPNRPTTARLEIRIERWSTR